ncbi:MAG TPA: DUF1236 domain-containing protein [Methyloceanibacter sp.]
MNTVMSLVAALVLICSSAIAQAGPKHGGHSGGGPAMHGGGPGPRVERHAEPRGHSGRAGQAHFRAEHAARHQERHVERRARADRDGPKHDAISAGRKSEKNERAAASARGEKKSRAAEDRSGPTRAYRSTEKSTDQVKQTNREDTKRQAGAEERKAAAKHVDVSGDRRERVLAAFHKGPDMKRHARANVELRVGRHLPRYWDFVRVPVAVVALVPEYDGYLFAYVDDDYVICDPETYEIVAILPASRGASYTSAEDRCLRGISLDEDEREVIIRATRHEKRVDVHDLTIGWSVPREITLQEFPDQVLSDIGELNACRYFVAEDEIAIVDPEEEKVVLLIDRS